MSLLTAEWAIARLQAEAIQKLAALRLQENIPTSEWIEDITAPSSDSNPSAASDRTMVEEEKSSAAAINIGRYHCTSEKHPGNLCLSTDGVKLCDCPIGEAEVGDTLRRLAEYAEGNAVYPYSMATQCLSTRSDSSFPARRQRALSGRE
jgi:hypothetical protein